MRRDVEARRPDAERQGRLFFGRRRTAATTTEQCAATAHGSADNFPTKAGVERWRWRWRAVARRGALFVEGPRLARRCDGVAIGWRTRP